MNEPQDSWDKKIVAEGAEKSWRIAEEDQDS